VGAASALAAVAIAAGSMIVTGQITSRTRSSTAPSPTRRRSTRTSTRAGDRRAEPHRRHDDRHAELAQHEQGAWITPTYAGANYTAQTGTWTVDSADVTTQAYYLKGRTLTVAFNFVTTSVSATPTSLNILNPAWGGFTSAKAIIGAQVYSDNSAAFAMGYVATLGTVLTVNKITGTWAIATNTTSANGQIAFEVQ
jgi:hypothetical protein